LQLSFSAFLNGGERHIERTHLDVQLSRKESGERFGTPRRPNYTPARGPPT
jgi:hypothetical protein